MNFMSDNGAVEYFWMSAAPVHETTQWLRAGSENGGLKCVKCSSPFKSNYKITNTYLGIPPLCFRFVPVTDREGHSPTLRTGGVSLKFSGIGGRMHALEQRSVERRLTFALRRAVGGATKERRNPGVGHQRAVRHHFQNSHHLLAATRSSRQPPSSVLIHFFETPSRAISVPAA